MKTNKENMKKLAIAYYYEHGTDSLNADVFACDDQKDVDKQFLKFANSFNDWGIDKNDIEGGSSGIYTQNTIFDCKGNEYKVILEPVKKS